MVSGFSNRRPVRRRTVLGGVAVLSFALAGCLGDSGPEVVYEDRIERGSIGEIYDLDLETGMGFRAKAVHESGTKTDLEVHDPAGAVLYDGSTKDVAEFETEAETSGSHTINVRTDRDGAASVTVWVDVDPA